MAFTPSCPIPIADYPRVLMAHGGGGRLTHQVIEKIFLAAFRSEKLESRHDGAVLPLPPGDSKLAFTTDSYVVHPIFFPGGDIGSLAVHGSVNDLAMCGARPRYLSAGFILEEGLPMEDLWRIACSMKAAADVAGVEIVTGDTKVVERGKGDGVFINTAAIGVIEHNLSISPQSVKPGDAIILSGDVGRHGTAVLTVREELAFESEIESDSASLVAPVMDLLSAGIEVHCLRDLTRGGLGTTLVEIAETALLPIDIDETLIPVRQDVAGACEILGFDPLFVANEGRFISFVPQDEVDRALEMLRAHEVTRDACIMGSVPTQGEPSRVTMRSKIGATRIVDMLSGEQLPRIC